jgi:drug/metabolite transporter (DMT)-like permease
VSRSLKAHILLVLVTLVWGSTFVLIKNALRDASPLLFNAIRMVLASVVLALLYRGRLVGMTRQVFRSGVVVGVFLWLGYEFQTSGLRLTTPSKSAFLTGVSVVLVPVLLAIFWRAAVNRWTWLGVLMAFAGLYFLTVPAQPGAFGFVGINFGDLLTIACAVGFAFQIIFLGRAARRHGFERIAFLQTATAAVLMMIATPILERPHIVWSQPVILAILITGLLGTAAAFTIQAWAQQFLPATHTALIFSLEPVFAWITSYIFLHERLGWRAGAGAALILAGIIFAETKGAAEPEHIREQDSAGVPATHS